MKTLKIILERLILAAVLSILTEVIVLSVVHEVTPTMPLYGTSGTSLMWTMLKIISFIYGFLASILIINKLTDKPIKTK